MMWKSCITGNDRNRYIAAWKKRLKHVHIKDKNTKGMNVKLGTGIAKFKKVFSTK